MEKEVKIQALANIIQDLIQQVDVFTQCLTSNDFEILEEAQEALIKKINYKKSAATLLLAVGGDPDTEDDEYKLKTMNMLIEFIKLRIEYRERMINKHKENQKKEEALKMFQNMGLF